MGSLGGPQQLQESSWARRFVMHVAIVGDLAVLQQLLHLPPQHRKKNTLLAAETLASGWPYCKSRLAKASPGSGVDRDATTTRRGLVLCCKACLSPSPLSRSLAEL